MLAKAREGFLRSLNIRKEVGDKEGMTIDLRNLGKLSRVQGDLATACSYWRECVEIFRGSSDATLARYMCGLGRTQLRK